MGTFKDNLAKHSKTQEDILREQYYDGQIEIVRKKLDHVNARIYKAKQIKFDRGLTPKEHSVYVDLVSQSKALIVELEKLYKEKEK